MTRKGIVRAAWVIAAGLMIVADHPAGAAPAADTAEVSDSGKPLKLTQSKLTKSGKTAAKKVHHSRKAKVAARRADKPKDIAAKKSAETEMPPAVADARAEMTPTDARGAAEITAPNSPIEIAASKQLDELDRAMNVAPEDVAPRAIKTQLVTDNQPQQSLPVIAQDSTQDSTQDSAPAQTIPVLPERANKTASMTAASGDAWAQSSLIGKIFIAFGGMLTLASAARMLIA